MSAGNSHGGAKSFGELLRKFRRRAELTQEALAERASLSVRAVSDLERGERSRPRRDTVSLLAEALDLESDDRAAFEGAVSRRRPRSEPAAGAAIETALPADVTPLLGRERDEAEVVNLLNGESRLVTLVGPGGVGKTSLAVRAGQTLAGAFSGDVTLVLLAPLRDHVLVTPAIAEALHIKESPGEQLLATVSRGLGQRRLLLILDNFEHVMDSAVVVSDLLRACPNLVVLTSSRERLHLRGEFVFEVRPLALADPAHSGSLEALSRFAAPAVFIQRARASGPMAPLQDSNAATVAEICRRLDGIPLALELGAARLRYMTAAELLSQLMAGLETLGDGPRDLPERQQTMMNAIAWSYGLLDRDEQQLLCALSAFSGGFDLGAVAYVVERLGKRTASILESVRNKSLIVPDVSFSGESTRYRMMETIREYAASQLERSEQNQAVRDRHAMYYVEVAEANGKKFNGPEHARAMGTIEVESPNIRVALRWLLDAKRKEEGLRLAGAIWRYWYLSGAFSEGRAWLEDLLALGGSVRSKVSAPALRGAGVLASSMSDNDIAQAYCAESLAIYQEAGDEDGASAVLNALGGIYFDLAQYERAVEYYEASAESARRANVTLGIAMAYGNMANSVRHMGDLARAERLYEDSLRYYRTIDADLPGLGNTLENLGSLALLMGHYEKAHEMIMESHERAKKGGRRSQVAGTMHDLGCVAKAIGDMANAEKWERKALAGLEATGSRRVAALALTNLAAIARARGDLAAAREFGTRGVEESRDIGSDTSLAYALLYLADIDRDERLEAEARTHYAEGLDINMKIGDLHGTADCLEHIAWFLAPTEPWKALKIAAAAELIRDTMGAPLAPVDQPEHDRAVAQSEACLNVAQRESARAAGRAIDPRDIQTVATVMAGDI